MGRINQPQLVSQDGGWLTLIRLFLLVQFIEIRRWGAITYLVQALCYKQEGHFSIPDKVIGFCNRTNLSSRAMALEFTDPLTETSTRNIPEGVKARPARKDENLTPICKTNV
jgi:hypothetical protein